MRKVHVSAWLLAVSSLFPSCNGFFGCEPSEPFEAIVIDNFMQSFDGRGNWLDISDTVSVNDSARRTMNFSMAVVEKYPRTADKPASWSIIPQAYACSPLYLPYSTQQFNGAVVTSNVSFGNSYPVGSDVSALFTLYTANDNQSSLTLRKVLDSLQVAPFIGENYRFTRYYFRGAANTGEVAKFNWDIYLDDDTLRTQSSWWQF